VAAIVYNVQSQRNAGFEARMTPADF